uniref:DNA-binding protein RHL1 n=1 Tax=Aegilops tauschii subsp. strangulata TaxID=200361 RepID=A0A453TD71_AEGTS
MVAKKPAASAAAGAVGPEAEERKRLRSLAFSKGLLQRGEPAAPRAALPPSGAVARLQGRDIVRPRGQRRGRFLFSFPGLLAPAAAGGRVGELADLGTKNPVLYLEFPQGRMKLLGTHVYPKNKYLTLQMTRSAKGVACEDVFESMIVFSESWWVGTKEENPDELKLEFPKEMQNAAEDVDFKGGAGAASGERIRMLRMRVARRLQVIHLLGNLPELLGRPSSSQSSLEEIRLRVTLRLSLLRTWMRRWRVQKLRKKSQVKTLRKKSQVKTLNLKILQQSLFLSRSNHLFRLICLPCLKKQKKKRDLQLQEVLKDLQLQKVLLLRSSEQLQRKNSHQRRRKQADLRKSKKQR